MLHNGVGSGLGHWELKAASGLGRGVVLGSIAEAEARLLAARRAPAARSAGRTHGRGG
jgi:hypothetical protein